MKAQHMVIYNISLDKCCVSGAGSLEHLQSQNQPTTHKENNEGGNERKQHGCGQVRKFKCCHINSYNIDTVTKRHILKATVILLPLLGMTWVFGLLAVNENTAVFAWLFTIFNSLQAGLISRIETEHYCLSLTQGVFIFFFHVLRNKTVSVHLSFIVLCKNHSSLHVRYHQGYTRDTPCILQTSLTRWRVNMA